MRSGLSDILDRFIEHGQESFPFGWRAPQEKGTGSGGNDAGRHDYKESAPAFLHIEIEDQRDDDGCDGGKDGRAHHGKDKFPDGNLELILAQEHHDDNLDAGKDDGTGIRPFRNETAV